MTRNVCIQYNGMAILVLGRMVLKWQNGTINVCIQENIGMQEYEQGQRLGDDVDNEVVHISCIHVQMYF